MFAHRSTKHHPAARRLRPLQNRGILARKAGKTCPHTPKTPVPALCDTCAERRQRILTRLRVRRTRHPSRNPLTEATLDSDTVEATLLALQDLETAELDIRRNPAVAQHPDIAKMLTASHSLSRYLKAPLAAAKEELDEVERPGAR